LVLSSNFCLILVKHATGCESRTLPVGNIKSICRVFPFRRSLLMWVDAEVREMRARNYISVFFLLYISTKSRNNVRKSLSLFPIWFRLPDSISF
jgi:hypothetical protein